MKVLVVGLGVTGGAVARALIAHGHDVVAADDSPGQAALAVADELGLNLSVAPDSDELAALVAAADAVVPAPGLPAGHPVFARARAARVPVLSEFDLAVRWDDRPLLAVTGTDGKTTVTTLVRDMLAASGLAAVAVGNTPVPLVAAIDDPSTDVFVVEASSFRLEHSQRFAPAVATGLNFAPDHLDSPHELASYEAAKARTWRPRWPGTSRSRCATTAAPTSASSGDWGRTDGWSARATGTPSWRSRGSGSCRGRYRTTSPTAWRRRRPPWPAAPTPRACGGGCWSSGASPIAWRWWARLEGCGSTTTRRRRPRTRRRPPSRGSSRSC